MKGVEVLPQPLPRKASDRFRHDNLTAVRTLLEDSQQRCGVCVAGFCPIFVCLDVSVMQVTSQEEDEDTSI